MKDLLEVAKNIKKGPKSSLAGILLFVFGGYMIYTSEQTLGYGSLEVGIFAVGLYLFLTSDGLFTCKEEDETESDS